MSTPDELRTEIVRLCRERWGGEAIDYCVHADYWEKCDGSSYWRAYSAIVPPPPWGAISIRSFESSSETEALARLLEKVKERCNER